MREADDVRWGSEPIMTVGHSTRTLDELVALLRSFDVTVLADIRSFPRSRRNPQFNADSLPAALRRHGVRYVKLAALGGRRRSSVDSPNTAFRNTSFRGFADYMESDAIEDGIEELAALANGSQRVALMCAEAVPWRCHRSLVADALTARGVDVMHIADVSQATAHRMTPFAEVRDGRVTYPAERDAGEALQVGAPFHLEATVRALQRRPTNLVDVWDDGHYLRVLPMKSALALIEVTNAGSVDEPDVRFKVLHGAPSSAGRAALIRSTQRILGLAMGDEPRRVFEAKRGLGYTARALRGMRPPRFAGLFEAFLNIIPFQQLSLDAGATIVARLVERFGESIEHRGRRFYATPRASVIAAARVSSLRACGLSARKAEVLRSIARMIDDGALTEERLARMSSAEAIRHLCEIDGVGPWTASVVLLRGFGRLDVFPPGDVGVARGLRKLMTLPEGISAEHVAERFGDKRGYLYFLSLGSNLLTRGLIHAAPAVPTPRRSSAKERVTAARTARARQRPRRRSPAERA